MEVRGERECRDCGTRWSYYETRSIACPACGSVYSVGHGDRAIHTASGSSLDLGPARAAVDDEPIDRVAALSAEAAREYRLGAGFVDAGELRPLDDAYLLAAELETVGRELANSLQRTDAEEVYLFRLLRGPESDTRPDPADVPAALSQARGLAMARAAGDYHRDLRRVLEDPGRELSAALSTIRARRKRIEALDGEVEPRTAERVVAAIRDVYAFLERDEEAALARIDERFRD
jgi:hypothetical protein